jgi:hypothetical protein
LDNVFVEDAFGEGLSDEDEDDFDEGDEPDYPVDTKFRPTEDIEDFGKFDTKSNSKKNFLNKKRKPKNLEYEEEYENNIRQKH